MDLVNKRYRCWLPDNGDESDAKPVDALHADLAAEEFARRVWAEEDHPDELTVCVREAVDPNAKEGGE